MTTPDIHEDLDFLADLIFSSKTLDSMLDALLFLAVMEVPGATGASITLVDGEGFRTTAHTSHLFKTVDAIQYEEDIGPCLRAIATGRVTHADLSDAAKWPGVGARTLEYGIKKVVSAPLLVRGENTGSLNLYSTSGDAFPETIDDTVRLVADVLSVLLRNFELYDRRGEVITQLHQALESRTVIDLAKGIIMERDGIDADGAFDALRVESQNRNIKVREVATRVVVRAAERRAI